MAERERKGKQLHEIIQEVRKTSTIQNFNSEDQGGRKGQQSEIQIMPDGQKGKKGLELAWLIKVQTDMTKNNFRGINNMSA